MKTNSNLEVKIEKNTKMQYIIIALLIINIIVTIVVNGNRKNEYIYTEEHDISSFKQISLKEMEDYVDQAEMKVLMIGKPNCEYTNKMLPIVEKAQEEFGFETLYVDLRTVTEEDQEVFLKYDDETNFLRDYLGTTPLIVVFKENKMVDTWVGYENYEVFKEFLIGLGMKAKEN